MRSGVKDRSGVAIVTGLVFADGTWGWGDDFFCSRLDVGQYQILIPKFKYIYAVQVTTGNIAGSFTAGTIGQPNKIVAYMWSPSLPSHDMSFTFTATGALA